MAGGSIGTVIAPATSSPQATAITSPTVETSTAAPKATLPVVVGVGDRVRATIPVENTADSIAVAEDAVWVSGWDGQLVSRIDVDTNEVVTVDVGAKGTHVSAGDAGVWVGVDGGQVLRLDPLTAQVVATVEIGGESAAPLSGDAAVWVVTPETSTLTRVDPVTNEVTATIDVSASGTNIIHGAVTVDGMVWVSLCEGGVVSVDEQTLAVSEPVALDGCAGTLGFTDESLWVALDDQRTARVDPVARAVTAVVDIGPADGAPFMATGDGSVWVPVTTATVARIDTATNTVTEILDLGRTGQAAGLECRTRLTLGRRLQPNHRAPHRRPVADDLGSVDRRSHSAGVNPGGILLSTTRNDERATPSGYGCAMRTDTATLPFATS